MIIKIDGLFGRSSKTDDLLGQGSANSGPRGDLIRPSSLPEFF